VKHLLQTITLAAFFLLPASLVAAGRSRELKIPDFTRGDKIPEGAKHDWNLGATGLRGWIFCDQLVTSDARQIAVTQVEKGSPAEGVLAIGDVILGVGGKPFSHDPRTELGKALTLAESEAGQGQLTLTRWRAGSSE
jgi:glutamine synthetase